MIKHNMITIEVDYWNFSKDIVISALLSAGLSRSVSRLSIILSLKLLLFVTKID